MSQTFFYISRKPLLMCLTLACEQAHSEGGKKNNVYRLPRVPLASLADSRSDSHSLRSRNHAFDHRIFFSFWEPVRRLVLKEHCYCWPPYLYIFQAAKNYPVDFSAIFVATSFPVSLISSGNEVVFVVFILPEVNMIGSRVTVDAPRERKQLEAFGKMSGLSSRLFLSFPVPPPCH